MELRTLEEFVTVAQTQSLHKAAGQLGVSPAALSQRMTALEKSIGATLLLRSRRNTLLTDAGARFATDAEHFLRHYNQSLSKIVSRDGHLYSSLRIIVSGGLIHYALASVLDSLNFRYPDLHIDLLSDSDHGIKKSLSSGEADLYFAFCYDNSFGDGVCAKRIFSTKTYAILRSDHHLSGRTALSLKELDGEQFILYPKCADDYVRQHQIDMLKHSGIGYSIYETDTANSLFTYLLPIGKGVLLSPWILHGKLTPNSVAIPLEDPVGIAEYCILYRRDNENPALHKIVQEILQTIREERQP